MISQEENHIHRLVSCRKKKKRIMKKITQKHKYATSISYFAILEKLMILLLLIMSTCCQLTHTWRLFDLSEFARSSYGFNPPPVNHNSQLLYPMSAASSLHQHHNHHRQQHQSLQPQSLQQPQSMALTNNVGLGAAAEQSPVPPMPVPLMNHQQPLYEPLRSDTPNTLSIYSSGNSLLQAEQQSVAASANINNNNNNNQQPANTPKEQLQSVVSAAVAEAASNLVKSVVVASATNKNSDVIQEKGNNAQLREVDGASGSGTTQSNQQQTLARDAASMAEAIVSAVAESAASKYLASPESNKSTIERSAAATSENQARSISLSNNDNQQNTNSSSGSSVVGKILEATTLNQNSNSSQAIVDKLGSVAMHILLKPKKEGSGQRKQSSFKATAAAAEQQIINQHATRVSHNHNRQQQNANTITYQRLLPTKQRDNKLVSYLLSSLAASSDMSASSSTSGQREPSSQLLTSLLSNLKTGITSRSSIVKAAISDNKLARSK